MVGHWWRQIIHYFCHPAANVFIDSECVFTVKYSKISSRWMRRAEVLSATAQQRKLTPQRRHYVVIDWAIRSRGAGARL
jgi:hypothetical protein